MAKPKFDRVIVAVHPSEARYYMRHRLLGRKIAWISRNVWSKDVDCGVAGYEYGRALLLSCPYGVPKGDLELNFHAISTMPIKRR